MFSFLYFLDNFSLVFYSILEIFKLYSCILSVNILIEPLALMVKMLNEYNFISGVFGISTLSVIGSNFTYLIYVLYSAPSTSISQFNDIFFENILNRLPNNSQLIVTGDININLLNPNNLNSISDFINNILSYNLFPVVSIPTRFNSNSNAVNRYSLIDQIWSNFYNGSNHLAGVATLSLTDHFPIFYLFKNNSSKVLKSFKTRSFTNYNIEQFISDVSRQSFDSVFDDGNPSVSFTTFYNILFSIYNKRFPVKNVELKLRIMKLHGCLKS